MAILSTTDAGSAPLANFVTDAMKNSDQALVIEQRVLLERLLRKHSTAIAAGITDFWRVAMNIVGPLPRTQRCNCYIFSVVDHFTNYEEANALLKTKSGYNRPRFTYRVYYAL